MPSSFSSLTNLYPVIKTLRRELKPEGKTLEHLQKDQGVLAKDTVRAEAYTKIKPILDRLHNDFINQSLAKASFDVSDFFVFYADYKKKLLNKKALTDKDLETLQKDFDTRKKILREKIGNLYALTAEERKKKYTDEKGKTMLKKKGYKILLEDKIQKVLEKIYMDDMDALKVIQEFNKCWTYFTGFNQNRENYYTVKGKATEIAFRVIDQNLITFCNNILLYDKIKDIGLTENEQKMFDPSQYTNFLTQEGIDRYNYTIGGDIDAQGKRITDGINQRINQYNQQHNTKLPQLTTLYKQIGSDKGKKKLFDSIESDEVLNQTIADYMALCDMVIPEIHNTMTNFFDRMEELDKVWISKANLNWLSNKFFANWYMMSEQGIALGVFGHKKDANKEQQVKIPAYVSLADVKNILDNIVVPDQTDVEEEKKIILFKKEYEKNRPTTASHWDFFVSLLKQYYEDIVNCDDKHNMGLLHAQAQLKQINSFDKNNQEHKNIIKAFADRTLDLARFLKLWKVDVSKWQQETADYTKKIDILIQKFTVNKYYDLIRNYVTQKPYSIEKMKLNFDCSTLLGGWDKNKETQNLSVILKDDQGYYLAIMKKDNNQFFEQKNAKLYNIDGGNSGLYKMEYKLLPGPNKMLPKCLIAPFFGKEDDEGDDDVEIDTNATIDREKNGAKNLIKIGINPSDDFLNNYKLGKHTKEHFDEDYYYEYINFIKDSLKKYEDRKVFDFQFKETHEYEDISKFYSDVERQGYKLSRTPINKYELDTAVENGQIYLFRISSKDFGNVQTDKKPDLQTLYRLDMFRPGSNIKLNGEAEVFFRPASLTDKKEKKTSQGKSINDKAIEKKRYTEDKILFHCPITLNFASQKITKVNDAVNAYIKTNHCNIIGIDRGEKHLNFYSVINPQGEILEQGTLNIFEYNYTDKAGNIHTRVVDYGALLEKNAQNRLFARQNRETIGKIKELKEGYISHVVKKIADLVLTYNAVVVLENLNTGFKNSRKKIEKSVYQNLEVALAKKLSFLVDKTKQAGELGSVTNPYQLCPETTLFGDIEKSSQRGVMLYTRAHYTSTTDPITGWRKTIYLKKGSVDEMKKSIQENFVAIGFDSIKQAYYIKDKKRTLRSNVERRRGTKDAHGQWIASKYDPTKELDTRCTKYNIEKHSDILAQIQHQHSVGCLQTLIWIIDLIMQIRNSDDQQNDFILSCVEDDNGKKFDSREYYKLTDQEKTNTVPKPTSGDANGAYNIARKGILMLEKIKQGKKSLYVSDTEWDDFVQNNHALAG